MLQGMGFVFLKKNNKYIMGGDWKEMFRGVETNDFNLVEYYLNKGIDVNYQHPEFLTSALIESIRLNHLEMLEFLIKNGASADTREAFSNKSPMTIAKELRNKQAVEILNKTLGTTEIIEEPKPITIIQKIKTWFTPSLFSLDFEL
jgi:uncharacterized protein